MRKMICILILVAAVGIITSGCAKPTPPANNNPGTPTGNSNAPADDLGREMQQVRKEMEAEIALDKGNAMTIAQKYEPKIKSIEERVSKLTDAQRAHYNQTYKQK